ncbi:MAG: LysM peptidoglycan-binding domain-containing protein [Candidatus Omnitrophica bacterium]|nr:LysM peptidoglycan-binding domain-containing protein [Candidatus Omnitrophota bacterium]MBM3252468.1 LysM peptidoglycan-binding domain-containing protein [Candidatus Omnitrophota bacterium]
MKNLKIIIIPVAAFILLLVLVALIVKNKGSRESGISASFASELNSQADNLTKEGKLIEAQEIYKKIVTDSPDFKDIAQVEKKLQDLNMLVLFSRLETPQTTLYEVKSGDSLAKIAKKFNTTAEFIKKSNGISSDVIKAGEKLRIWSGKFSCVVDKSQNTLILKSNDDVVKVYLVSTGADNHTPVGIYKIINKLVNPPWYKEGAAVPIPPESPENILGTRWMGFDIPEYGIHGTTEPESIGKQATKGCVRMLNKDVEELYSILPVGTEVTIID